MTFVKKSKRSQLEILSEAMMTLPLEHAGTASVAAEFLFITIYVLAVLYVPSNAPALRLLSLATLAAASWALGHSLLRLTTVPQWRGAMVTLSGIQLLNASEILCVFAVDSLSLPKTIALLWNLRRIGTQWEIKNLAPTRREARARFLLRRVSLTFLAYLALEVLVLQPPPRRAFIALGKDTLFDWENLSADDVMFRVGATIGMGMSVSLLNLIMANVANIAMVTVGASRPEECPTLNGSVVEAYTVRKFWGWVFCFSISRWRKLRGLSTRESTVQRETNTLRGRSVWQQGLQRPLAGHANAIVNAVLPRGSLLSRMSRLIIAFFISGLIHLLVDIGLGVPRGESGAVLFFCLQPLGIMTEEAVQSTVLGRLPVFARKVLGYLWVIAFMSWSVPVWLYPHLRLGMDAADMLPFHFVSPVIKALTPR